MTPFGGPWGEEEVSGLTAKVEKRRMTVGRIMVEREPFFMLLFFFPFELFF